MGTENGPCDYSNAWRKAILVDGWRRGGGSVEVRVRATPTVCRGARVPAAGLLLCALLRFGGGDLECAVEDDALVQRCQLRERPSPR